MKCEETSRAILEGWRQILGLEIITGETKQELRTRLKSSFYGQVALGREEPKKQILDITRDFIKERL